LTDVAERLCLERCLEELASKYQMYGDKSEVVAYRDITEALLHVVADKIFPNEEFFRAAMAISIEIVVDSAFGEQQR
jgi:hypothetical protein